jgi:mono/diheme cytochrome c family protein
MLRSSIVLCATVLMLGSACAASAADAQQGKALVDQHCIACHGGMMSLWKGKSAADIDGLIHEVVAGKVPHPKDLKPLGLSDAQIADIAAYFESAGNP